MIGNICVWLASRGSSSATMPRHRSVRGRVTQGRRGPHGESKNWRWPLAAIWYTTGVPPLKNYGIFVLPCSTSTALLDIYTSLEWLTGHTCRHKWPIQVLVVEAGTKSSWPQIDLGCLQDIRRSCLLLQRKTYHSPSLTLLIRISFYLDVSL